jgi:hypothetical protein
MVTVHVLNQVIGNMVANVSATLGLMRRKIAALVAVQWIAAVMVVVVVVSFLIFLFFGICIITFCLCKLME